MANHPRPGMDAGGERSWIYGSNARSFLRPAASVNADFKRLTAQLVLEQARAGTLDIGILEALLLAVGLEP